MNEQIKLLAEQAGFVDKGNNITAYLNFDHEKFAELIVQECAGVIQDFVIMRVPASQYPALLKKYFGVQQ